MDIKRMNEALNQHNSKVDKSKPKPASESKVKLSKTQQRIFDLISQTLASHASFKLSNKDIHKKLGVAYGYASQTINKLSKMGLIQIKGKTSNREITLTEKGHQLVAKHVPKEVPKAKAQPNEKIVKPKYNVQDVVRAWKKMPRAQQKIFNTIVSDTSSSGKDDRYITRLSNGDLARLSKVSHAYVSNAISRLKKANFIKTAGFTENRIIFLAPAGIKLAYLNRTNNHKYQHMANELPQLQSRIFDFIYNHMVKPKHGSEKTCSLNNKEIAKQLKLKYNSTTASLAILRKKHLIKSSGKGAKRVMTLTPKGRQLAKHVDPQVNPARNRKSSIMIGTNRINLNDLVPLNVHSPIYPYELIFKRGDKESKANPFINGNDEITLKGSKFFELLKKFDAVRFYQDQTHPDIIGLKPCHPNRSDPAVVKLIKHNHRIVIWSYMLVQSFNRNAQPGTSQHLYIPGKKLGHVILFNAGKVKPYFK